MNGFTLLEVAAVFMLLFFAAVHAVCMKINNAGFVDVAWSYAFSFLALLFAGLGPGLLFRRMVIASMVTLWSVRLGTYLFRRVLRHHPTEDGRYTALRESWKPNVAIRFFLFFEAQGILVVLLSIPFLLSCYNAAPQTQWIEWCGATLWCVAVAGEGIADRQMAKFKAKADNKGKVCQDGLWNYSRHPNYFFESLVWWAYFLFALGSPYGWVTVYCPLVMLYFLFRVTGIPLTEEQAIRSKGDAYREYQGSTSAFIPWFKRRQPSFH